jgi:hypothetical protein
MPACRHSSSSFGIAFAVSATIGMRSPLRSRARISRRRVAVEHRHLAIHQHQVVASLRPRIDGFAPVDDCVDCIAQLLQETRRDLFIHDVVFGEQDALAAAAYFIDMRRRRRRDLVVSGHYIEARREPERRANAFATLDARFAAHELVETPHDRQAETRAAVAARGRGVDLRERPEQRVDAIGGNADEGVANFEAQHHAAHR